MRKPLLAVSAMAILVGLTNATLAIPELQIYVEGATYDMSSDTWVIEEDAFRIWAIGNVGQKGTIFDAQLVAAFDTSETGTITLIPTTTSLLTDPSTPSAPVLVPGVGGDGDIPVMNDGGDLPTHGVYGPGTSFIQWEIGDLSLTDSPVGDFFETFPTTFPTTGQINAYDVIVTGYSTVHFDLFNHYISGNKAKYVKAPFSHDGEGGDGESGDPPIPEPGTLLLVTLGVSLTLSKRFRRRD